MGKNGYFVVKVLCPDTTYNNFYVRNLQTELSWLNSNPININIFPNDNSFQVTQLDQQITSEADEILITRVLNAYISTSSSSFESKPTFIQGSVNFNSNAKTATFQLDSTSLPSSGSQSLYIFIRDNDPGQQIYKSLVLNILECDKKCASGSCSVTLTNCTSCPPGFDKVFNSSNGEYTCIQCQSNQFIQGIECVDCLSPCATCSSSTIIISQTGCKTCIDTAYQQSTDGSNTYCESMAQQQFGKYTKDDLFYLQVYPYPNSTIQSYVLNDQRNPSWITLVKDQKSDRIKLGVRLPSQIGVYHFYIPSQLSGFINPKIYRGTIEVVNSITLTTGMYFQEYLTKIEVKIDSTFTLSEKQICKTQLGFTDSLQLSYSYRQDVVGQTWINIPSEGVGPFSIITNPSGSKLLQIQNNLSTFFGDYEVKLACENLGASVQHIYMLTLVKNSAPQWKSKASISYQFVETSTSLKIDLTNFFTDNDLPSQSINTFSLIASTSLNLVSSTNLLYAPGDPLTNKVMISDKYEAIFEVSSTITVGVQSIYFWIQDSREAQSSSLQGTITVLRDCWSTCESYKCSSTRSELACTACKSGLVFHRDQVGNKKCYSNCVNGEYDDFDSSQCRQCTQGCQSCKGPGLMLTSTICQYCSQGWYSTGPSTQRVCSQSCGAGFTFDTGSYECYQSHNPRFIQPYSSILSVRKGEFKEYTFKIDAQNDIEYSTQFKIFSGSVAKNNLVELNSQDTWIKVIQKSQINEQDSNILSQTVLPPLNIIQLGTQINPVPEVQKEFFSEQYLVRFELTQSPDAKKSTVEIAINLMADMAPRLKDGISTDIGVMTPNVPFTYLLRRDFFYTKEGLTMTLNCKASNSSYSWIQLQNIGGDIYVQATVPNNLYANSYVDLQCNITNSDNDTATITFRGTVQSNKAPLWLNQISDKILYFDQNYTAQLSPFCSDLEGDALTFGVQVNGIQINWRQKANDNIWFDRSNSRFSFLFSNRSQIGINIIQISCQDNFNQPIFQSFKITAEPNRPPSLVKLLPDIRVDIFTKNYDMQLTKYFTDPEGGSLNYQVTSKSQSLLTSAVEINQNGQLVLNLENQEQGIHEFTLIATDNQLSSTQASFKLIVQGCFSGCASCFGLEQNQCLSCSANLAFQNNQCVSSCASGKYQDSQDKKCKTCPFQCKSCFGGNSQTQCSECNPDYYFFNNGCSQQCPSGYYKDETSQICRVIDPEQTTNYKQCQDFIQQMVQSEFLTDNGVKPFEELASKDYQCQSQICTGKVSQDCKWKRKFALSCGRSQDGFATIRIQTNSLPNHCISRSSSYPQEGNIDFSVKFDIPVSNQVLFIKSNYIANYYRCTDEWLYPEEIPQVYDFRIFETDDDLVRDIVGVALNGVPILRSLTDEFQDFFSPSYPSPQTSSALQKLDQCIGGYELKGFYSYFSASHCIINGFEQSKSLQGMLCSELQACRSNQMTYMQQNFGSTLFSDRKVQKIGIAKDGHFIVGPFNTQGKLWQPCEVDFCNGAVVDGSYVYASTMFYPYTVGCWGPSTSNLYTSSCSLQSQVCSEEQTQSSSIYLLVHLKFIILVALSMAFHFIL